VVVMLSLSLVLLRITSRKWRTRRRDTSWTISRVWRPQALR